MDLQCAFWRKFGAWLAILSGVMLVGAAVPSASYLHKERAAVEEDLSRIFSQDLTKAERQRQILAVARVHRGRRSAVTSRLIALAGGLLVGLAAFTQARKRNDALRMNTAAHQARATIANMPSVRYRTFWPRFWAGFLDGFALAPLSAVLAYAAVNSQGAAAIAAHVASNMTFLAYSIWLLGTRGQTLGKWLCRVKVLDVAEGPLRLRQACWRDIGLIVISIAVLALNPAPQDPASHAAVRSLGLLSFAVMGWYLLELATMLTNARRRALHDFIARSVVVRCAD